MKTTVIRNVSAHDVRYTLGAGEGSDAIHKDPQYSFAVARLHADGPLVVADAAAFLISDQARFLTGCILPVSGGAELGYRR